MEDQLPVAVDRRVPVKMAAESDRMAPFNGPQSVEVLPDVLAKKWRFAGRRGMRNGGDRKQPHGVFEVKLEGKRLNRIGWAGSLSDLHLMGRKGWKSFCKEPAWFIIGRERGKLSYCWKHAYRVAKSGKNAGEVVNPDTGMPIVGAKKKNLAVVDFGDYKRSFNVQRGNESYAGHTIYSPIWQADNSRLKRMAPLDYIGRYMPDWFDYGIADEIQEYNEDTIQGGGLAVMARACRKNLCVTGTLLGGKARDIYGVFQRRTEKRAISSTSPAGVASTPSTTSCVG